MSNGQHAPAHVAGSLTVILPPLHPGQRRVEASQARFKVVAAGRRWGKTRRAALRVIRAALADPGGYFWVAPSFPLAQVGWEEMLWLAGQIPGAQARVTDRRITLPGCGWVQAKSAQNIDSLRSRGLKGVVLEEAAFMDERAWTLALRPALADQRGWAEFVSTPNGHNWFYELAERAQTDPGWAFFHAPTWENPFIPADEIEQLRDELGPLGFAQEIEAEFTAEGQHAFRPEDFRYYEQTADGYVIEPEPGQKHLIPREELRAVQAIDLAFSTSETADYFVCITLAVDYNGNRLALDLHRDRVAPRDQVGLIENLYYNAQPKPTRVAVEDAFQQVAVIQDLKKRTGIPVHGVRPVAGPGGKKDKFTRSLGAAQLYLNRKVFHPRAAPWLAAFERELWDFPLGRHDDQVDALVYAVQASDLPGAALLQWYREQRAEEKATSDSPTVHRR